MSKLQELLDLNYSLPDMRLFPEDWAYITAQRNAFTEGYNAAMQEKGDVNAGELTERQRLERDYNPGFDHSDFHTVK